MHRRTSTIEPRAAFQLQLDRHYFEIHTSSGVIIVVMRFTAPNLRFIFKVGLDELGIGFVDDCGWYIIMCE